MWYIFVSTTSRSSFRRTRQGSLQGWPCNSCFPAVVWARLSSVWPIRTCCLIVVTNYFSKPKFCCWLVPVLPENQNWQGRKKEEMQKATSYLAPEASLPHLSLLSKSSPGVPEDSPCIPPRGTREKADLFRHTLQSIFPSIPFHSAAVIQVCSAQLFSLKYPTLQTGKKISLRSNDPGKKQSFPCEQNEGCTSKSAPTFNMQLPLFYLLKM